MNQMISKKLIVAISSRALFDLDASHDVYEQEGIEAYRDFQVQNERQILQPGAAFHLAEKLLKLNEGREEDDQLVEVILLSRNSADTGLRIFHSIEHYGLDISRAAFAGGESPYVYAKPFAADLFLSLNADDVKKALQAGCAAAQIYKHNLQSKQLDCLKIAFDGDAVLFSDESEQYFQANGVNAFNQKEKHLATEPMNPGPFRGFLQALHRLQQCASLPIPIRTALVTARQAPAHERVVNTLRSWQIRIDESLFLGGLDKTEFLQAFDADLFFDDQRPNCEKASHTTTSAHVPYGVKNNT